MLNEKRYHLLRDLGVYKASIRNNYESGDLQYEYPQVRQLLDRRTQSYTLTELDELSCWLWTSHDDCVLENSDDYLPIQYYTAKAKVDFGQSVIRKLAELRKLDEPPAAQPAVTQEESAA